MCRVQSSIELLYAINHFFIFIFIFIFGLGVEQPSYQSKSKDYWDYDEFPAR